MTDSQAVTTFLADFNHLHRLLKKLLNDQDVAFASAVQQLAKKHPIISAHQLDLDAIRSLRNLIVHEKIASHEEVAIPSSSTIALLKSIIEKLNGPQTADYFTKSVTYFNHDLSLQEALKRIASERYSQYPVFRHQQLIGILSAQTITHWLAQVDLETVNLENISCEEILKHNKSKPLTKQNIISPDFPIFKIDDRLLELLQHNYLPVLLMSNQPNDIQLDNLMGIITPWDLPTIFQHQ